MLKNLNKIIAGVAVLSMLCTSMAFAADPVDVTIDGDTVTVAVSTPSAGEETTLLVVPQGVKVSDAFEDTAKIYHMDQAASKDGVATFSFKYTGTDNLDIYSGYATMDADDIPYEGVLDLSGGTGGGTSGNFTYGDVNNDGKIDTFDALAVIDYYLHEKTFKDSTTDGEEYEFGLIAANVNGDDKIDTFDALAIIDRYLHETEFKVGN